MELSPTGTSASIAARALSSPTTCRFIPALSGLPTIRPRSDLSLPNQSSACLRCEPRRRSQTDRNHDCKYDRHDKEVSPTQNCHGGKANDKRPPRPAHERQTLCPNPPHLPL